MTARGGGLRSPKGATDSPLPFTVILGNTLQVKGWAELPTAHILILNKSASTLTL